MALVAAPPPQMNASSCLLTKVSTLHHSKSGSSVSKMRRGRPLDANGALRVRALFAAAPRQAQPDYVQYRTESQISGPYTTGRLWAHGVKPCVLLPQAVLLHCEPPLHTCEVYLYSAEVAKLDSYEFRSPDNQLSG